MRVPPGTWCPRTPWRPCRRTARAAAAAPATMTSFRGWTIRPPLNCHALLCTGRRESLGSWEEEWALAVLGALPVAGHAARARERRVGQPWADPWSREA